VGSNCPFYCLHHGVRDFGDYGIHLCHHDHRQCVSLVHANSGVLMTELIPEHYDGFGFTRNAETGEVQFFFFDDIVKEHGVQPGPEGIPPDRVCYHVLLQHYRKGAVKLETPFTSNFTDALTYARHVGEKGFTGFMIRVNRFSLALAEASMKETIDTHTSLYGFWAVDPDSKKEVFFPGRLKVKKEKEKSSWW
jgi:hypothetical protein